MVAKPSPEPKSLTLNLNTSTAEPLAVAVLAKSTDETCAVGDSTLEVVSLDEGMLYVTSIEFILHCVLIVFAFLIFKFEVEEIPEIV